MSEYGPEYPGDEALERELAALGALMLEQEQAEASELDPVFLQSLRAYLVAGEEASASAPAVERPVQPAPPILLDAERRRRHPRFFVGGLASAVVAAAVLALVLNSRIGHSPGVPKSHPVAFAVPTPNPTQLAVGYPFPQGLGGGGPNIPPWRDTIAQPPGVTYPGKLHLSGDGLPSGPAQLPAYQFETGAAIAARLPQIARKLGISGKVQRSTQPDGVWVYASDNDPVQLSNVHSVAVNLTTGELIYHDLRDRIPFNGQALANAPGSLRVARAWLIPLGWSGATMPVFASPPGQALDFPQSVRLAWSGVTNVDMPAALFHIGRGNRVDDVDLYPTIARATQVPVIGYQAAWSQVLAHKIPLGVAGFPLYPPAAGSGKLGSFSTVQVYTQTPSGALYLVPAYRFGGPVTLPKATGPFTFVAIVPASKK